MSASRRGLLAAALLPLLGGCIEPSAPAPDKAAPPAAAVDAPIPNRPKLPGVLRLTARERKADGQVVERPVEWKVAETAVIVCDMWDDHYCKCAAQRVGVMVPRMNAVLTAARDHGVQIVHAPSGTVDLYADTPFRKRLQ